MRYISGERIFSASLMLILASGYLELKNSRSWERYFSDIGVLITLSLLTVAMSLLLYFVFKPTDAEISSEQTSGKARSIAQNLKPPGGLVLGVSACGYPLLIWAIEFLPATVFSSIVALSLFSRELGHRQIISGITMGISIYIVFFLFLGVPSVPGAIFSTGLDNIVPSLRQSLFFGK